MLRQLLTSIAPRPASMPGRRLQPGELQLIIESLPEVTQAVHARQTPIQPAPRSVCTTLKDLCEF